MAEPYRWGDVPPAPALRIRSRREFRTSSLYARMKRGRIDRAEAERVENLSTERSSEACPCAPVRRPPAGSPPAA